MSMFKKILVPVDGSEPSNAAVSLAIRLARDQEASIAFVHVCEVAKIAAMVGGPTIGVDPSYALEAEREWGDQTLRRALDRAGSGGVDADTCLEEGPSVTTILEVARDQHADLIVMGSHGRGGITRVLLGSVTEGVLRHTHIPVMVTRAKHS